MTVSSGNSEQIKKIGEILSRGNISYMTLYNNSEKDPNNPDQRINYIEVFINQNNETSGHTEKVYSNGKLEIFRPTASFDFAWAIFWLRQGKKLQRAGWNGKNMYIFMLEERNFLPTTVMKTASGEFLKGWLASQSDLYANDWQIVNE